MSAKLLPSSTGKAHTVRRTRKVAFLATVPEAALLDVPRRDRDRVVLQRWGCHGDREATDESKKGAVELHVEIRMLKV